MKTSSLLAALLFCVVNASPALAADPKPKAGAKPKGKPVELNLPSVGALPSADGLSKPKEKTTDQSPTTTAANATYQIVRVMHGRAFNRSAGGATPVGGALETIALSGNPPSTEKFGTIVRVKSPQRTNAPIDVVILDPRGDTTMSHSGELNFRGTKQDEVDYSVEWDPTPQRSGGAFQVMVRIGGQVMGTWPLKVASGK
jgi:hypothetical protein